MFYPLNPRVLEVMELTDSCCMKGVWNHNSQVAGGDVHHQVQVQVLLIYVEGVGLEELLDNGAGGLG